MNQLSIFHIFASIFIYCVLEEGRRASMSVIYSNIASSSLFPQTGNSSSSIEEQTNGDGSNSSLASSSSSFSQLPMISLQYRNGYIQQKVQSLKLPSYETLKTNLIDSAERKNSSKALTTLKTLIFYQIEKDLLDPLLNCALI